jgi:hypothetical protein
VARQFLDHSEPEDRPFRGVMQHVQPDQTRVQVAVGGSSVVL